MYDKRKHRHHVFNENTRLNAYADAWNATRQWSRYRPIWHPVWQNRYNRQIRQNSFNRPIWQNDFNRPIWHINMNCPTWHMKNNCPIWHTNMNRPNLAHDYVVQCYAMRYLFSFTHKLHILSIPQNHQNLEFNKIPQTSKSKSTKSHLKSVKFTTSHINNHIHQSTI